MEFCRIEAARKREINPREIMAREIKLDVRILLKSLMKCSTVLGQGL